MRRFVIPAVLVGCALGWLFAVPFFRSPSVTFPDGAVVRVEIADSPEDRQTGLSEHIFLHEDRGMLFLLDGKGRPSFWMKDMDFPIDIIWISGETVVGIEENVPVLSSGVEDGEAARYTPELPVDHVLEVNAGFAAAHGLEPGQTLDIDLP